MTIAAPTSAALPTQPAASATTPVVAPPLGATPLPAPGPSQDVLVATLQQLVQTLSTLLAAMQGAAAVGGGAPQLPTQSPVQAPTQGGGPSIAGSGAVAPAVAAAGAPAAGLQPVDASYRGPYMSAEPMVGGARYSTAFESGSGSYAEIGGSASMQFFGRYGSANVGYGTNTVSLSSPRTPIGTRLQLPDTGSVTLSTGAAFSWSTRTFLQNQMTAADLDFAVTRGGQQLPFSGATVDQVNGFGERVSSPLTAAEMAELVDQLAARFPAVQRR